MLRLLSDKNFNGYILEGLHERTSELDVELDLVRLDDVGLGNAADEDILEWAAQENRVLLSHDKRTMPKFAYQRVDAGLRMPGVLLVHRMTIGDAVEAILLFGLCGSEEDTKDQVIFLHS